MSADKSIGWSKNNRMIWYYAGPKKLGITSEELHLIVSGLIGKDSLKELTERQQLTVIDDLRSRMKHKRLQKFSQDDYINKLAKQLGWIHEDGRVNNKRLTGFIKKRYRIQVDNVKWMTVSEKSKVIEGMKAMLKRLEDDRGKNTSGQGN